MRRWKLMALALAAAALALGAAAQAGTPNYYQNAVFADGPVVYYEFNEGVGSLAATNYGSAGKPDGTYSNVLLGQPTPHQAYKMLTCGQYSGNSQVTVPSGVPGMCVGTGDFSVEMWFRADDSKRGDLFSNLWSSPRVPPFPVGAGAGFVISSDYNQPDTLSVYDGNGDTGSLFLGSAPAANGVWHYLVVTRSGGTYTAYVDAVKTVLGGGPTAITDFNALNFSGEKWIGSGTDDSGSIYGFTGLIDEFAFYGTALSQDRVNAHYTAAGGIATPEPGTLALLAAGLAALLAYAWRKRK